jgi:hypothetical protein
MIIALNYIAKPLKYDLRFLLMHEKRYRSEFPKVKDIVGEQ